MSIEEGLTSTNVATIRSARGAAKGHVTKNVRSLRDRLVVEGSKFLFDEIDDDIRNWILHTINSRTCMKDS